MRKVGTTLKKIRIKALIRSIFHYEKLLFFLLSLIVSIRLSAQQEVVENPIQNFEILWSTFNDRYANFELKQVVWDSVYGVYRPMVYSNTTNKSLFDISCSMLQTLQDGHVTIEPNFDRIDTSCGPPYTFSIDDSFPSKNLWIAFEKTTLASLRTNGLEPTTKVDFTAESNFQYGVSDRLAYLRLDEMLEQITLGKFRKAIDRAIEQFNDKEGLIIDLRFNGGGWDYISYQLASRFVPKGATLSHYVQEKKRGNPSFKKLRHKKIKAKGKRQFTKPIVILTSDYTASTAEVFILLMKDLPNVKMVGDYTEGIFSDMFAFKLPNKWLVTLSHKQFFSADMVNYEGKGIPPNIRILNSRSDIENQEDAVLKAAINYLTNECNND